MRIIVFTFLCILWAGQSVAAQPLVPFQGQGKSDEPVEIEADNLVVHQNQEIAVFDGNVEAVQGDLNLRSHTMVVYYKNKNTKKPAQTASVGENTVSKIYVKGDVHLTTPRETAKGDSGIYDVENGLMTLKGSVVLTKAGNVVKGQKLLYDLNTGKSELVGGTKTTTGGTSGKGQRVKGLFVPK